MKWFAQEDVSKTLPNVVCTRLESPPAGIGATKWFGFWNLVRKLSELP